MGKAAGALKQKSPAEFFAENRNIAGFDNVRPARSLAAGGLLSGCPDACPTFQDQLLKTHGVVPARQMFVHDRT